MKSGSGRRVIILAPPRFVDSLGALCKSSWVVTVVRGIRPWRGARLARRDEGANWAFETEEQRSQEGCPAWELFRELR